MKKLFIHIGTPKTATTYIQHFLFENADRLFEDGVYYPCKIGKKYFVAKMHVPLISSTTGVKVHWLDPRFHYPNGEALEEFIEDVEKNELDKILISSEAFYDALTSENLIGMFRKSFKSYDTKIIIYLRRQDQFLISYFQESVKGGNCSYIDVDDILEKYDFNMRYYERLKLWANVFGKENIIVRPFEKSQFKGNNIIIDFLSILGINSIEGYKKIAPLNESISLEKLCFLLKLNNFLVGTLQDVEFEIKQLHQKIRDIIINNSNILTKGSVYDFLTYEEKIKIINRYSEDNAKIANEFLNRKDGVLFYENLNKKENSEATNFLSVESEFEAITSLLIDAQKKLMNNLAT